MTRLVLFIIFLLTIPSSSSASQKESQYTGKLDSQLSAARVESKLTCTAITAEDKSKLPASVANDAQVFAGELKWSDYKKPGHKLLLIQSPGKPSYILVDIDKDGAFGTVERYTFSPYENMKDSVSEGEVVIQFPLTNSSYKNYPVRLRHLKADEKQEKDRVRHIAHSLEAFATGTVTIQGRKTLVEYQMNQQTGKITGRDGWLAMDSDGDGRIDRGFSSNEVAYGKNESVIFRVGERYLSTQSVDSEKSNFVLLEHPASDYQRIELRVGAQIPDFNFTDFEGKARKLSEFRGKFVLLDFWGTWCDPCVYEIPNLKKAYEKYQSRGFEILGMVQDQDMKFVKKFAAEQGITWTNATTESISQLIDQRFRITMFPTTILLDPNGKISSLNRKDQLPLAGKELLNTLEKLTTPNSR